MERREFIALTGSMTMFAGCATNFNSPTSTPRRETDEPTPTPTPADAGPRETDQKDSITDPADQPITDHRLDIRAERWGAHPVWIDQDEYLYGRGANRLLGSDDWWQTDETLFTFGESDIVRAVVVPESGRVIVGIEDRSTNQGRIEVIDPDFESTNTAYQFEYGYAIHTNGHVTYDDIVIMSSYGYSDFEGGRHPSEVILSTDGGETFERILDVELNTTNATNNHIHDVEYDPYADRIWVSVGDHGNSQVYWSNDMGESWTAIDERGKVTQPTQIVAFKDSIAFATDSYPAGIIRWERDDPNDEPTGVEDLTRPYVAIEDEPAEQMRYWGARRWHVREDDGRELCLIPFRYSHHPTWRQSVVLGTVDGKEWYELFRVDNENVLLSNVMGPVSLDGELRTVVSDSTRNDGFTIDATVPAFWE